MATVSKVRTALSPNAGLKLPGMRVPYDGCVSQNSAKPERGIETEEAGIDRMDIWHVRTALSPNAGLKQSLSRRDIERAFRQNSAKPERGIETQHS